MVLRRYFCKYNFLGNILILGEFLIILVYDLIVCQGAPV